MSYSVQVVVIGDEEGEVRTWVLDNHDSLEDALADAAEVAAEHQRRTGVEPMPLGDEPGGQRRPFPEP